MHPYSNHVPPIYGALFGDLESREGWADHGCEFLVPGALRWEVIRPQTQGFWGHQGKLWGPQSL